METKVCKKCGIEKDITDFRKSGKYYRTECKECAKVFSYNYRKTNSKKVQNYNQKYKKENKDILKLKQKEYAKKYYQKNKDYVKQKSNDYYYENKEKAINSQKRYRENNSEKIKSKRKEYDILNKEKINEYQRNYIFEKRKNNKEFKLKCQIRHMLKMSFNRKSKRKSNKLETIVGCSINELIKYLIGTYENNYNEKWDWKYLDNIHIDHIKPLSLAQTESDIIELNHYTNLQLLKAKDNLKKSNKLDWRLNND